jgi:hypothetical protein
METEFEGRQFGRLGKRLGGVPPSPFSCKCSFCGTFSLMFLGADSKGVIGGFLGSADSTGVSFDFGLGGGT